MKHFVNVTNRSSDCFKCKQLFLIEINGHQIPRTMEISMSISSLPLELLSRIFQFIERPHHWSLRTTSRLFYRVIYDNFDQLLNGRQGYKPKLIISISQDCDRHHVREYELVPDIITKNECLFRLSSATFGFVGLTRVLEYVANRILNQIGHFESHDYLLISQFLNDGWQNMPLDIPVSIRPAYSTLFGYIVKTLQTLSSTTESTMDSDLQMSLLAQTWRVIDILAPPNSRDLTLCSDEQCCGEQTVITLNSHYKSDETQLEHYISLGNKPNSQKKTKWAWKGESSFMRSSIHKINLCPGMVMEFEALQYMENKVSVGDLRLKVDKWWLLANL